MWPTYNFPPLTSSSASSDSLKPKIDINPVAKTSQGQLIQDHPIVSINQLLLHKE